METDKWKISKIIELFNHHQLFVDREYQRGMVWKPEQKKKLIDSIMRKFPIPLLILQKDGNNYNIIDGQQRIESIIGFYENKLTYTNGSWSEFRLLDASQFPLYDSDDSWLNKNFHNLTEDEKNRFRDYPIQVIILENYSNNEIRDVFVRLQSGSPLNFQEKMDSLPGNFNEFILKIGGKELIQERNLIPSTKSEEDFSGHEFYTHFVETVKSDRGKTRKLCADSYLLFREFFIENKITSITQTKNQTYYLEKFSFEIEEPLNNYFLKLLDELIRIDELKFENNREKLKNYEAIHLILFASICKVLEFEDWKNKIGKAFIKFRNLLAESSDVEIKEFKDAIKTDTNSTKTIIRRMEIFSKYLLLQMYDAENYLDYVTTNEIVNLNAEKTITLNDIVKIKTELSKNPVINENFIKIIFLPNNKDETEDGYPTHRITKITAYYNDGKIKEYNSSQKLYLDIFPSNVALNRAGLIFGTKDNGVKLNETFWKFIKELHFTMNSKKYTLTRNDFDDFWEERYK